MDPAIRCSVNAPASHDPEVARTELNSSTVHSLSASIYTRAHKRARAWTKVCGWSHTLLFHSVSNPLCPGVWPHFYTGSLCARAIPLWRSMHASVHSLYVYPVYVHTGVRWEVRTQLSTGGRLQPVCTQPSTYNTWHILRQCTSFLLS